MAWIVRIFFVLAAPIAALLAAQDSPKFDILEAFVAVVLMTALVGLAAVWTTLPPRSGRS